MKCAMIFAGKQKPMGCFMSLASNDFLQWLNEWTFKTRRELILTHDIHKYPAMFIPEVVEKIISLYTTENDLVLDIFSGSGTTLLESMRLKRKSIGIELNPLACLISKVKTTAINKKILEKESINLKKLYYSKSYKNIYFDNIDFWFSKEAISFLSDLFSSIGLITDVNFRDLANVSASDIIRNISLCKHSGFKMHRDKNKIGKIYTKDEIYKIFENSLLKNISKINELTLITNDKISYTPKIYNQDSRLINPEIGKETVDLIITSPPYGDSKTTVAYGQFSRLSSQFLNLKSSSGKPIAQLDNELLGGKKSSQQQEEILIYNSITLKNIIELFKLRSTMSDDRKIDNRLSDIVCFYYDLFLCLENSHFYLKQGKFFVLVTASRIVHDVKLHTDIIISELANNIGFKLKNIHYRDIPNKRMPSKVSATNIKGEVTPTMTTESIIILEKI